MTHPNRSSFGRLWRWLATLCVLLLVLVACLGYRAVQVRTHLLEARAALTSLGADPAAMDPEELRRVQRRAQADVAAARQAVDDPLWRAVAAVPVAGSTLATVSAITRSTDTVVAEVLPPLITAFEDVKAGELLADGRVDLALLETIGVSIERAGTAAAAATAELPAAERYLPGAVQEARRDLEDQLKTLTSGLGTADTALTLAPPMLGAQGPRRYFLAVQNNAETRGTGGLVGAYAVLRVDQGAISLERVGTNQEFRTADEPVVDLGPEYSELYDQYGGRTYWSAAVITPHWPSAAAVMAGLWEAQGGGPIDGVIGIDPLAMADILAVTGPAQVGGRTISADNVVDFVMRDEYAEFADGSGERKEVLSELAAAIYREVIAGDYEATAMARALADAGGSGHLQLYSDDPEEQVVLAPLRVAGALPSEPGAYLQVSMTNAAGNKADYYLRRKVGYRRVGGIGTVTVELTNTVDPAAVPPIVIGRLDDPEQPVDPGQTRLIVSLVIGVGEKFGEVRVNGKPVAVQIASEQGHGVAVVEVEVSPQRPTVIAADVTDPGGELVYRQQPLVVDDTLELEVPYRKE